VHSDTTAHEGNPVEKSPQHELRSSRAAHRKLPRHAKAGLAKPLHNGDA
jgi:hypothetical protein